MNSPQNPPVAFVCDAMLGGLARWLRAAGYDAFFEYGIEDARLVDLADRMGRVLLSCDGPMFERTVLREGTVAGLFIPRGLSKLQQLRYVLQNMDLPLRQPRCMACGGALEEVPRHQALGEAPPLAYRNCRQFWRCGRCGKLLWRGTHWHRISENLAWAAGKGQAQGAQDVRGPDEES